MLKLLFSVAYLNKCCIFVQEINNKPIMKTTNEIRSKVMKAAWKTFSKRSKWSFPACLKSAWKWEKETLMEDFKIWMPKSDFGRAYFGQNYIQFSIKERSAKGYYESHRSCKGESYATAYFKLVGISMEEVKPFLNSIACKISGFGQNIEFVESKF